MSRIREQTLELGGFGNYPMIPAVAALEDLDALELDEEARDLFLEGNARRVFGLGTG